MGNPWILLTGVGVLAAVALATVEDKSKVKYVRQFLVNRAFSLGSLLSLSILMFSAFQGVFTHFTIILVTSGIVCMIISFASWRRLKSKVAIRLPYFWVGVAFILGLFSASAAYALLPSCTTVNGLFTVILLIVIAITFLIKVIAIAKPQVWVGLGVATFIAFQMPSWLEPKTFFGVTIAVSPEIIAVLSLVGFIVALIVMYVLMNFLVEGAGLASKALNSFPMLFVLGLLSAVWGLGLGVFQWSL